MRTFPTLYHLTVLDLLNEQLLQDAIFSAVSSLVPAARMQPDHGHTQEGSITYALGVCIGSGLPGQSVAQGLSNLAETTSDSINHPQSANKIVSVFRVQSWPSGDAIRIVVYYSLVDQ